MRIKVREFFYISNLLSLSRILIIVPIVYLVAQNTPDGNLALVILAFIAALTDVLDGYLSRKLDQITDLGILLDPVADKIAMAVIYISLIIFRNFPVPLIVFLLYRDLWILISGTLLLRDTGKPMMANIWGKINTFIFAAIALLFLMDTAATVSNVFITAGYATLFISTISYGISGLRLFTKKTAVRIFIWTLVIVPALGLYWYMRGLHFFL